MRFVINKPTRDESPVWVISCSATRFKLVARLHPIFKKPISKNEKQREEVLNSKISDESDKDSRSCLCVALPFSSSHTRPLFDVLVYHPVCNRNGLDLLHARDYKYY